MTESYFDRPLRRYLDDASSNNPTPGGGSVSALAGALGVSMGSMAANFTTDPKKFADRQDRIAPIIDNLLATRRRLESLVEQDIEAYALVGRAFGMPRKTDDEKRLRRQTIQEALKAAMEPPLETVRACAETIERLKDLVDCANKNLISDVGVAAILAEAALRGARLNVEINLASLKDAELVDKVRAEVATLSDEAARGAMEVTQKVEAAIGGAG